MSTFDLSQYINTIAAGTNSAWNGFQTPIPANMIIYAIDTQTFKKGDGSSLYSSLVSGPSLNNITSVNNTLSHYFTQLTASSDDALIIIDSNKYSMSYIRLTDLTNKLSNLENKVSLQSTKLTNIQQRLSMINNKLTNGRLTIVENGQITQSSALDINSIYSTDSELNFKYLKIYSDIQCTNQIYTLTPNTTFYAKVFVQHDEYTLKDFNFTLSSNLNNVTFNQIDKTTFSIVIGNIVSTTTLDIAISILLNNYSKTTHRFYIIYVEDFGPTEIDTPIPISVLTSSLKSNLDMDLVGIGVSWFDQMFDSVTDIDGNIYIIANIEGINHDPGSITSNIVVNTKIIKLDSDFNFIKQVSLDMPIHTSYSLYSIPSIQIIDNVVYVTGSLVDSVSEDDGSVDFKNTIFKFDTNLNLLNKVSFNLLNVVNDDFVIVNDYELFYPFHFTSKLFKDNSNNLYISGYFSNSISTSLNYIFKISNLSSAIVKNFHNPVIVFGNNLLNTEFFALTSSNMFDTLKIFSINNELNITKQKLISLPSNLKFNNGQQFDSLAKAKTDDEFIYLAITLTDISYKSTILLKLDYDLNILESTIINNFIVSGIELDNTYVLLLGCKDITNSNAFIFDAEDLNYNGSIVAFTNKFFVQNRNDFYVTNNVFKPCLLRLSQQSLKIWSSMHFDGIGQYTPYFDPMVYSNCLLLHNNKLTVLLHSYSNMVIQPGTYFSSDNAFSMSFYSSISYTQLSITNLTFSNTHIPSDGTYIFGNNNLQMSSYSQSESSFNFQSVDDVIPELQSSNVTFSTLEYNCLVYETLQNPTITHQTSQTLL